MSQTLCFGGADHAPGPNPELQAVAQHYLAAYAAPVTLLSSVNALDRAFHWRCAAAYDAQPDPGGPVRPTVGAQSGYCPTDAVRSAYSALVTELRAQAALLRSAGFSWTFVRDDPYTTGTSGAPDSRTMQQSVLRSRHLLALATDATTPHPLLSDDSNNLFRAVHDLLGHCANGYSFSALGEENAYRAHANLFSPLARRALACETRGQNSWYNFGPYSHQRPRPFAVQKAACFPSHLCGDYPQPHHD